uniref:ADOR97 n=1 Tax=Adoxophyes orana granulovirus TaxID=170617 RepID=A0A0A7UYE1_GVAO|nr:ADOR97 [Adoxophyes orana granulovirus]
MAIFSLDLFDILQSYNWQIVDNQLIEIVPNDREDAWKDLFLLVLRNTPRSCRKYLRLGTLIHFDYKQPIYYDLKTRRLGLMTDEVLQSLNPPRPAYFNSRLIRPISIVCCFILIALSYIAAKGVN